MENTYICHVGVGHLQGGNSGRYPWGSGAKWNKKRLSSGDPSKSTNKTSAGGKSSKKASSSKSASSEKKSSSSGSSNSTNKTSTGSGSSNYVETTANAGVAVYDDTLSTLGEILSIKDKLAAKKFIDTTLHSISDDDLQKLVSRLTLENNYMTQSAKLNKYKVNVSDVVKLSDQIFSLSKNAKNFITLLR